MGKRRSDRLTRRDFLRGTALGALGWGAAVGAGCTRQSGESPAQTVPTTAPGPRPRVVIARDAAAISDDGQRVDATRVNELLAKALKRLTDEESLVAALGRFVRSGDRVGIKHSVMMTPVHEELLWALWEALEAVGVPAASVITWDRDQGHRGYRAGEPAAVSYDADHVATICSEFATVLLNVPGLKSHWVAGLGACLKNWAGAVSGLDIRDQNNTPWPIHGDSCADIGMLQAHPSIQGKLRLCVVDALRPLCHGGPQVNPQYLWNYGGIIVGTDAVAVDRVGLDIIQKRRNEVRGEEWPLSPPPKHIATAAAKYHLGEANLDRIEVVEV